MNRQLTTVSKFLSLVLRHKPELIGLEPCTAGWVEVNTLLQNATAKGKVITRETLERVVTENNKKRFSISACGQKIRANQGHSFPVDLGLQSKQPPTILFHGTAKRFWPQIQQQGLMKKNRHHVHLSADRETAQMVGARHGSPIVLEIAAAQMAQDQILFYYSQNGVWLTGHVPPKYLVASQDEPIYRDQTHGIKQAAQSTRDTNNN